MNLKVEILSVYPQPNGPWMEQFAHNLTCEDSFLAGKKYLICDRDSLYSVKFNRILKAAGVELVKLLLRSPNLNAHEERSIRSTPKKCPNQLTHSSEQQLRYVLTEYLEYHHHERISTKDSIDYRTAT